MSEPIEIILKEPVTFGSETIEKLVLRRPVGRDFRELDATRTFAMMLDLAAALAGVSPKVIDQLCAEDTLAVCDRVGGFLPGSPKTGAS